MATMDDAQRARLAELDRTVRQLLLDVAMLSRRIEQLEGQITKPGKGAKT